MQKAKPPSDELVLRTTDVFGNEVVLKTSTWTDHILAKHPEMTGSEGLISQAISDPMCVRESSIVSTAAAFETHDARKRTVSVLVNFDDENYTGGGFTGTVSTAYTVDTRRYPYRKVRKPIYKKKTTS